MHFAVGAGREKAKDGQLQFSRISKEYPRQWPRVGKAGEADEKHAQEAL